MNRTELEAQIVQTYQTAPEHPWSRHPGYAVFRHKQNRKWFAVIMDLPKSALGLTNPGTVDVLNLKCDPILIGALRSTPGFYPAYHMSKTHWISITLDGTAEGDTILQLLAMSYALTAPAQKP